MFIPETLRISASEMSKILKDYMNAQNGAELMNSIIQILMDLNSEDVVKADIFGIGREYVIAANALTRIINTREIGWFKLATFAERFEDEVNVKAAVHDFSQLLDLDTEETHVWMLQNRDIKTAMSNLGMMWKVAPKIRKVAMYKVSTLAGVYEYMQKVLLLGTGIEGTEQPLREVLVDLNVTAIPNYDLSGIMSMVSSITGVRNLRNNMIQITNTVYTKSEIAKQVVDPTPNQLSAKGGGNGGNGKNKGDGNSGETSNDGGNTPTPGVTTAEFNGTNVKVVTVNNIENKNEASAASKAKAEGGGSLPLPIETGE